MVFSSLFFVYVFLTLQLFFYYRAKTINQRNIIMLIFSLVFYSWNGPKYLILLLVMVFIGWFGAIELEKRPKYRKPILVATIAGFLLILGYFKYAGFFAEIFNFLSPFDVTVPSIVLPIGISFYTFQLLSYVVDVYRGDVEAQKKFSLLLLYVSLFHQCIAGPIVRYQDVEYDITKRKLKKSELLEGVKRFCIGLAKKAIIANSVSVIADKYLILNDVTALSSVPALGIWLGALAFAFQIYFDFSAYSDMAIGMGLMTGFHYKENFNHPYIARSISEFWRRWHISLGTFFRDYVYIPLGGNREGNVYFNLFVVWFLTGMWHGASMNYIIWGLYFLIFIMLEKRFIGKALESAPKILSWLYMMVIVVFGWVLFKFEDFGMMMTAIKGMFGLNGNGFMNAQISIMVKNNIFLLIFAAFASTNLLRKIYVAVRRKAEDDDVARTLVMGYDSFMPWVLLLLSTLALIGNSYNPFLYFQF